MEFGTFRSKAGSTFVITDKLVIRRDSRGNVEQIPIAQIRGISSEDKGLFSKTYVLHIGGLNGFAPEFSTERERNEMKECLERAMLNY